MLRSAAFSLFDQLFCLHLKVVQWNLLSQPGRTEQLPLKPQNYKQLPTNQAIHSLANSLSNRLTGPSAFSAAKRGAKAVKLSGLREPSMALRRQKEVALEKNEVANPLQYRWLLAIPQLQPIFNEYLKSTIAVHLFYHVPVSLFTDFCWASLQNPKRPTAANRQATSKVLAKSSATSPAARARSSARAKSLATDS